MTQLLCNGCGQTDEEDCTDELNDQGTQCLICNYCGYLATDPCESGCVECPSCNIISDADDLDEGCCKHCLYNINGDIL